MAGRNPLTIGYDINNNASKLVEISFSSVDLADVADVAPLQDQVLVFSGGAYAPSSILSFSCNDLASCDHGILAGLGDNDHPQYQTSSTALTSIAGLTLARGDILLYDGSNLTRLAMGTTGYVLTVYDDGEGAGALPAWRPIPAGGD